MKSNIASIESIMEEHSQLFSKKSGEEIRFTDGLTEPQSILKGLREQIKKNYSDDISSSVLSLINLAWKAGRLEGYTEGMNNTFDDQPTILIHPNDSNIDYLSFGQELNLLLQKYAGNYILGTNIHINEKPFTNQDDVIQSDSKN